MIGHVANSCVCTFEMRVIEEGFRATTGHLADNQATWTWLWTLGIAQQFQKGEPPRLKGTKFLNHRSTKTPE